jgi:hypothetical protein
MNQLFFPCFNKKIDPVIEQLKAVFFPEKTVLLGNFVAVKPQPYFFGERIDPFVDVDKIKIINNKIGYDKIQDNG